MIVEQSAAARIEWLINKEAFSDAIRLLDRELKGSLDESTYLALRAEALAGLAEFEKAAETARRAQQLDWQNARAHYVLGVVAAALNRPQDAVQHYAAALAGQPDFAPAHYALGSLLRSAGESEVAARELQTAARLDPDNWRYAAGVAVTQPWNRRYAALRTAYRAGMRVQPRLLRLRLKYLLTFPASLVARIAGDSPPADPRVSYAAFQRIMARVPLTTYAMLAAIAAVFLFVETPDGSNSPSVLLKYGALDPASVIHLHQYWRLVMPLFLHIGWAHIGVNSLSLYYVGTLYERCVGKSRFLYVYFVAGIGGSVVSLAAINDLAAGASGAIFGIFGALGVYAYTNRAVFGLISRRLVSSVVGLSILNLLLPILDPQIDGWAHFGGLLTGIVAGLVAGPWLSSAKGSSAEALLQERRRPWVVLALMALVACIVLAAAAIVVIVNPLGA